MNTKTALAIALLIGVSQAAHAVEPAKPSDVTVTGKQVTEKDLEGSNPVVSLAKDDIMSFVSTGKPGCKQGSVTAEFAPPSSFVFTDETVPLDHLAARIQPIRKAGKISCFHVAARTYDRAVYDRLKTELVDGMGISLFWDDAEPEH